MSTDQENHENGAPRIVDKRGKGNPIAAVDAREREIREAEAAALLAKQAAADDSTPVQDPNYKPVLTAFLVILDHAGNVTATSSIELVNELQLSREAVLPDMYSAAAHIMKDVQEQETAVRVMNVRQQQASAAREQMQAERLHQQVLNRPNVMGRPKG